MVSHAIIVPNEYAAAPTNAEASYANGDKRQDKRDANVHVHQEKTITVVKNVPVPYKVEKLHPVKIEKIVHVPVHVKVPQPFPGMDYLYECQKIINNMQFYSNYLLQLSKMCHIR